MKNYYLRLPLFVKIIVAAILGGVLGHVVGKDAAHLKPVSDLVLQLLRLLATPLIFLSIVHSILRADVQGKAVGRLAWVLLSNTAIAILLGLGIANLIQPGLHVHFPTPTEVVTKNPLDPVADLLSRIPKDFVSPFATNDLIGIIVVALAVAIGLRAIRGPATEERINTISSYVELGVQLILRILHWVLEIVPLAVLAVIASVVGTTGFQPLIDMSWFAGTVILGLVLMFGVYLFRLRISSWVRPAVFIRGAVDAFTLAFSTASSAATLPVTYECAVSKIGVTENSASLGIMVSGTLNHDGSALYQAMAALFVGQATGQTLPFRSQFVLFFMAIVASVSAAGIPESGLVTMLAVFSTLHLPIEYVPLLLPLDWILDRFRTLINVAGDLAATCILDGKQRPLFDKDFS